MAKPISRKDVIKALTPGLNALFSETLYEIIERKDGWALLERTYGMADDVVVASGLTHKEVKSLYKITTGENYEYYKHSK